jgi:hypothetical protein
MKLFIIENDATIDLLSPAIYDGTRDVIVCFNYLVYDRLDRMGKYKYYYFIEELLSITDYDELHGAADHFPLLWFNQDGVDISEYQGVSWGELLKNTFARTYKTMILVKYGEVIRKAKIKWPDISIVYYDFSNKHNYFHYVPDDAGRFFNKRELVEEVAAQLEMKAFLLEPGKYIPSAYQALMRYEQRIWSIMRLKSVIKYIIDWLKKALRKTKTIQNTTMLFNYFNITSILGYVDDKYLIIGGHSSTAHEGKSGPKYLDINSIRAEYNREDKKYFRSLQDVIKSDSYRNKMANAYIFKGINYSHFFNRVVIDIALIAVPGVVLYFKKVRLAIKNYDVKKIILNEEIDDCQQAVLAACASDSIKSIFTDHGIQGQSHAGRICDRSKSDVVVCSGSYFVDYYLAQANEKRTCVALGNPCLDLYPSVKRRRIKSIKNILLLTFEDNFYARLDRHAFQEKYYKELISIFNDLLDLGMELYLKPHPAEEMEYLRYLFNYFNFDLSRIHIIEGLPFHEVIGQMDLVVSNVSSCYYESIAAGVPTIFFEPNYNEEAFLRPLSGKNWEEVIRAETGSELLLAINTIKTDPEKANIFMDKLIEKYQDLYLGKLDGRASRRIIDYINSI